MTHPSKELQTAIEAVKEGAKIALSYYNQKLLVELKVDKTVVTQADKDVEQTIINHVLSKFPDAKFLGEETGGSSNEKKFWIIDPIDGTRSFIRGIPTWDILLAYCVDGEVVAGVSYFPVHDTMIWAEKGKGAYIDGEHVHVSKINKLNESVVGLGYSRNVSDRMLVDLVKSGWNVRIMAAYSAYHVAKGSMEVYVAPNNKVWDFAAYKIIIEEAGGKLTKLDGTPWDFETIGGILSNGLVHDEVVTMVNKH